MRNRARAKHDPVSYFEDDDSWPARARNFDYAQYVQRQGVRRVEYGMTKRDHVRARVALRGDVRRQTPTAVADIYSSGAPVAAAKSPGERVSSSNQSAKTSPAQNKNFSRSRRRERRRAEAARLVTPPVWRYGAHWTTAQVAGFEMERTGRIYHEESDQVEEECLLVAALEDAEAWLFIEESYEDDMVIVDEAKADGDPHAALSPICVSASRPTWADVVRHVTSEDSYSDTPVQGGVQTT